jgi:hypothetical protein
MREKSNLGCNSSNNMGRKRVTIARETIEKPGSRIQTSGLLWINETLALTRHTKSITKQRFKKDTGSYILGYLNQGHKGHTSSQIEAAEDIAVKAMYASRGVEPD